MYFGQLSQLNLSIVFFLTDDFRKSKTKTSEILTMVAVILHIEFLLIKKLAGFIEHLT